MADIRLDDDPVFGDVNPDLGKIEQVSRLRENARGRIALWIVGSLFAIVLLSYLVFTLLVFSGTPPTFDNLKDLTEALVAPVVGIVGAVTGFYFGEKRSEG